MLRSIRSRLIISYLLVIILAMGIAAGLAWSALDRAFRDVLRENLLAQAQRVAQTVESDQASGLYPITPQSQFQSTPPAPNAYSQASNVLPGFHTRVIDSQGVVILGPPAADETPGSDQGGTSLSGSDYDELFSNLGVPPTNLRSQQEPITDLLARPEIQSALLGEPATAVRSYDWAAQRRVMYAAYPVRSPDGGVVSVAYIASPLPRLALSLLPDTLGPQIVTGMLAATLLAGLVGWLLARQLTRPLRQLTHAAAALGQGQSVPPIPPSTTTELHTLGKTFNVMNTNLTEARNTLEARARERIAILDSLADAVLAADSSGAIILVNPAASTLLELSAQAAQEAIQHTLATGKPHTAEVVARDRVFELLSTPLRDEEGDISGAVVVGHDVTAFRQLDRLRTNFVADVSHELRTPLTAIRGFVETLQDGAADDPTVRDRFLDTIAHEADRLIRLTNDLLLLTRADAGRLELRMAPVDIVVSARETITQLETRATKKQIALHLVAKPPDTRVPTLADADRIHQVLFNLLDNAIKFTPINGRITVFLDQTGEWITCKIADNGPGIPLAEIPYLFERFYRGDRSRVRDEDHSGAGLGLTIAKAIIEAHGGHIWIESAPGQGTIVAFTLPHLPQN
jgi:signal transduction histidine kinase